MKINTTLVLFSIISVIIGIFFGWLIWGNRPFYAGTMMHQMPNGHTMSNSGMDMDDMMQGMMAALSGKTGYEFDQAFLAEMIIHHEGAVIMAQQVLAVSKRPELIKLAHEIITAQTKEIAMMKEWQTLWFKAQN